MVLGAVGHVVEFAKERNVYNFYVKILADSDTPHVNQCDAELDRRFTHAVCGDVEHVALCSI